MDYHTGVAQGQVPRWLEKVRGTVLITQTPFDIRRALAGWHNTRQQDVMPLSMIDKFKILRRAHEELQLGCHVVTLAGLISAANAIDVRDLAELYEKIPDAKKREKAIGKRVTDLYGGLALLAVHPNSDQVLKMLEAWAEDYADQMTPNLFRGVRKLLGTTVAAAINLMHQARNPRLWIKSVGPLARKQWCQWQVFHSELVDPGRSMPSRLSITIMHP
jgi:hypothetical protein